MTYKCTWKLSSIIKSLWLWQLWFCITALLISANDASNHDSCLNQNFTNVDEIENQVRCTLEILNPATAIEKVECLDRNTVRIVGEYQVLRILCSASFPLDLEYSGFQPTEAIRVQFSKEIEPNSSRKLKHYKLELKVYSVQALYEHYVNISSSLGKSTNANLNDEEVDAKISRHTSSRTGNYKIHDVFNKTRALSIYLFLEDVASSDSFMRNKNTVKIVLQNDDTMIIPCRPSRLHANVSLYLETEQNETISLEHHNVTFTPKIGFSLGIIPEVVTATNSTVHFVCKLNDVADAHTGGTEMATLRFKFPPDENEPKFGFENLPSGSIQENINIHSQVVVVDTYNFQINIDCTVDNPVDSVMTVIEAKSPSYSHLVQEFVFPGYINGSYSGVVGVKASPPGVFTLKGVGMAGLVFCMSKRIVGNDTDYKVLEYATGFDRKVRFFKYGQDWSAFDVTESPAGNHLQIIPGTLPGGTNEAPGYYYVNQTYAFKVRVRVHGLAPPVIWYQQLENGTIVEEHIEYELDDENFSHFRLLITDKTKEIYAAASFWDRQLWKNVSLPIQPTRKEGLKPLITNTHLDLEFIHGTSNQVLKCEAIADPKPSLTWEKDSMILLGENSTDSLILEFPTVNLSNAGHYTCIAKNIFGSTFKTFTVGVVEEERANYAVSIGIPTFVFLLATVGTYLYFRFLKKEPIGLTKKEIEAFEQGSPEFTKEMGCMVPENALNIPYNKAYEIEEKNFQVATSEILGSGQFGIVYKGIIKGQSMAAKTLKNNADKDYLKALLSELKIMCYLGRHEHLVELIGASTTKLSKGIVYIFVELCSLGSLEHFLRTNRQNFVPDSMYGNLSYMPFSNDVLNTQQLYIWSYQISKAMEYLAFKKVIHGDLATRNVLLSAEKNAKVTDFGLSRQLYNYDLYVKKNQEPLPWRWMAVESLRDLVFSTHSDAWSFGITLWEIFSLAEVPYPGLSWDMEFVEKLEHGLRMLKPKYGTPKLYEELLLQCWHTEPESRPSFELTSQYILNLINVKPLPPHYIKHSDALTTMQTSSPEVV